MCCARLDFQSNSNTRNENVTIMSWHSLRKLKMGVFVSLLNFKLKTTFYLLAISISGNQKLERTGLSRENRHAKIRLAASGKIGLVSVNISIL